MICGRGGVWVGRAWVGTECANVRMRRQGKTGESTRSEQTVSHRTQYARGRKEQSGTWTNPASPIAIHSLSVHSVCPCWSIRIPRTRRRQAGAKTARSTLLAVQALHTNYCTNLRKFLLILPTSRYLRYAATAGATPRPVHCVSPRRRRTSDVSKLAAMAALSAAKSQPLNALAMAGR